MLGSSEEHKIIGLFTCLVINSFLIFNFNFSDSVVENMPFLSYLVYRTSR